MNYNMKPLITFLKTYFEKVEVEDGYYFIIGEKKILVPNYFSDEVFVKGIIDIIKQNLANTNYKLFSELDDILRNILKTNNI